MASYLTYKDELKNEYYRAFDRVETYSMSMGMDSRAQEEMLMELLDTLLEAQRKEKPVSMIIGEDVEQFCKQYFSGYSRFGNLLKSVPERIYHMCILIFIFTMIDICFPAEEASTAGTTDISYVFVGLFTGILTSALMVCITKLFLFRWKKFSNTMYIIISIVIFVLVLAAAIACHGDFALHAPITVIAVGSALYAVIYKALRLYDRYQKYGSLKKPDIEKEASVRQIWKDSMQKEMEKNPLIFELVKQFDKKNARLTKRGKAPMTEEAYDEKVRRDMKWLKLGKPFYFGLFILFTFVPPLASAGNSEPLDTLIFFLILAAVEAPICSGFYKMERYMYETRLKLLQECEEQQLTLIALGRKKMAEREIL